MVTGGRNEIQQREQKQKVQTKRGEQGNTIKLKVDNRPEERETFLLACAPTWKEQQTS